MANGMMDSEQGVLAHVGARKRALKDAQRRCKKQAMRWIGGVLYFVDQLGLPTKTVPNTPRIPKPGREAIGMRAIHESVIPKELRSEHRADEQEAPRRGSRRITRIPGGIVMDYF